MTNPRVIFFGNERLATGINSTEAPLLNGLIASGYSVVAVASHDLTARSRKKQQLEVAEIAKTHNIPFLTESPRQIASQLQELKPDIAVLAAYGHIISQSVIDLFPKGILNIHPSLLPLYRGSSPIESSILNGDPVTGVSLMQLTAGMDEGPVYDQVKIEVKGQESKRSLHDRLAAAGAEMLLQRLPDIIRGELQPTPQNDPQASYTSRLTKSDGAIDWQQPAIVIERQIRAYSGWPGSHTSLNDIELVVTAARAQSGPSSQAAGKIILTNNHELAVATGDGQLLIEAVKPIGKKEMPVKAFLAGYKSRLAT